ncbi:MAG: hypothetical protein K2P57_09340 [Burkholderiales bacterium]|nr:hypothetical protein [Burkholderiales bacterium]
MIQPGDVCKKREIHFSPLPQGQAARALDTLAEMDGIRVEIAQFNILLVSYQLPHHRLETIEETLVDQGFHLDNSLLQKIMRSLVHYVEEVQCQNLCEPDRTQKNMEIFVKVYEHHPHGDHDETPQEWREYR